jgi:hypothetical protein
MAFKWNTATFSPRDATLSSLAVQYRVVNINCEDISKTRVNNSFSQVFGYSTLVDPLTFRGQCVQKSDLNARHDGRVIECPAQVRTPGCVYQRLINNEVDDGLVMDIRVPVFRTRIPFVYLKYRNRSDRFGNTNTRVILAEVNDVLGDVELDRIHEFSKLMGLDYGELDVLRDREDQRLYIVDVNPTPWGPPNHISEEQARQAVTRMAVAFREGVLSWD